MPLWQAVLTTVGAIWLVATVVTFFAVLFAGKAMDDNHAEMDDGHAEMIDMAEFERQFFGG